jgi:hypothetical protein
LFDQTRGESLKKTTNALIKKASNINPESLHSTAYGQSYGLSAPKTAMQIKADK